MTKIEIPYMRIEKTNELLKKLTPSLLEKGDLTATYIAKFLKVSRSTVSNLIKTLKAFRLIEGKSKFKFTQEGKNYVNYLIRNKENEAKELLKKIIENLEYIPDLKQKLNQKGKLTISEIGNHIALQYNQKWENPLTVKAHGAAIASAMGFAEIGYYKGGYLFIKKIQEISESVPAPTVGSKKIIKILNALFSMGKNIHELSSKVNTKEGRLSYELSCCIELGLVERPYKGFYKLSQEGELIISPHLSSDEKKAIFKDCLLRSRYGPIIEKWGKDEKFDKGKVGKILKFEFGRMGAQWESEKTINAYAKKFTDWLSFAGLLEKISKEEFKLKTSSITTAKYQIKEGVRTIIHKHLPINLTKYYLLGKNVGLLNSTLEYEKAKEIVENIIAICREDEKLKVVLQDFQEDYKLFLEIKDSRIFIRNLKKLEKILGARET